MYTLEILVITQSWINETKANIGLSCGMLSLSSSTSVAAPTNVKLCIIVHLPFVEPLIVLFDGAPTWCKYSPVVPHFMGFSNFLKSNLWIYFFGFVFKDHYLSTVWEWHTFEWVSHRLRLSPSSRTFLSPFSRFAWNWVASKSGTRDLCVEVCVCGAGGGHLKNLKITVKGVSVGRGSPIIKDGFAVVF